MPPTGTTLREAAKIGSRWTLIQELRQAADQHLASIAADAGADSLLLRHCQAVWGHWEREALISILHHDYTNAEVMLDRGVHVLGHALALVHEDRLSEEEMVKLIAAA